MGLFLFYGLILSGIVRVCNGRIVAADGMAVTVLSLIRWRERRPAC
jgi:hypothetical protein